MHAKKLVPPDGDLKKIQKERNPDKIGNSVSVTSELRKEETAPYSREKDDVEKVDQAG